MGKEFLEIFEQWADSYDDSLTNDKEYEAVFRHYDRILTNVAERSAGHVVEFGPGTGNLTLKLIEKGLTVTAIEPSPAMRRLAKDKIGTKAQLIEGDFLHFKLDSTPNTFVSTYAFHHLTDQEKDEAIKQYSNLLPKGGKIVFADTMYVTKEAHYQAIKGATGKGQNNLAEDLQREYYTTIPILTEILEKNGFSARFEKMNDFVWIMEGKK
ncbi:class I SAM-dependent methyltransferase [Niallia sp.]|uniref:class I SAM-dependent DNA methyltransferase n=1 Tax=Niallia sp. TaxID=2837523 RepID=UPI00289B7A73|nr:class I SAM-dependent methyltransferase [Niallia sp.]